MHKPNCYECKHRGEVPGSAHSCCNHPITKADHDNPLAKMLGIFAGVGRALPITGETARKLNIKGNACAIPRGWFNWPFNFDPVWLESCDGFEAVERKGVQ